MIMNFNCRIKPSLDAKTISTFAPYYGLYILSGEQSKIDERIDACGGELDAMMAVANAMPSFFRFTFFRVLYAIYEDIEELNKEIKRLSKYGFYLSVYGRNTKEFNFLVRNDEKTFDQEVGDYEISVFRNGFNESIQYCDTVNDLVKFYRINGGINFYFTI